MEHIVQESAENSGSIENISFCYDLPLSVNQKERKSCTKQSSAVHFVRKQLMSLLSTCHFFLAHALIYFFLSIFIFIPLFSLYITCESS